MFRRSVGRYQIRDESGSGGILTAKEWGAYIKLGMTVSMAMVLGTPQDFYIARNDWPSCATP